MKVLKRENCAIAVKTVYSIGGSHNHIRKVALEGQGIEFLCFVECSVSDRGNYPIGTTFIIKAKLTDRQGTPFIYSHHSWPCYQIDEARAIELIKEGKLGFRESARWDAFIENKANLLTMNKTTQY